MPISFNGSVTINGNVEMYDNGSMKITGNEVTVNVSELKSFVEKELPFSINKEEYKKAAETLSNPPQDKGLIKKAFHKIIEFTKESGKAIWIAGLTGIAKEVAKEIAQHITK
ncbi:hypothetical protein A3B85_00145 [Candidatus Nomurabacteria bacterium RIFCSPHIGHO2_02_FULL_37_13]|uniref:Uncharacterized protein n=1 Tax=Candidatus Nomurabacteria bacterium RIFCSPHIGHO2_02_FULL_37_13 TaxID=1801750 RepID=A0A1F6W5H5_9BACT|nr:MAG: hypothetical protein A2640_02090 [Candidatus Nomurabacteria bacterium RIFCSPHIGHO2_01_FULL_36_23]OGI76935.1 MAG: hypothetical protein A3B85_00145 [Candidatus Nomurabacteria bacterium RIFCSPHIGHO2_02_FULL_37_13]OGI88589.1 MAG: hypothetical protein A2906_01135 [Candidatus Nomurabacteria bacterium RIFCSPLOWO2_01_FULL_37_25]